MVLVRATKYKAFESGKIRKYSDMFFNNVNCYVDEKIVHEIDIGYVSENMSVVRRVIGFPLVKENGFT